MPQRKQHKKIRQYLFSKGYFNAKISYKTVLNLKKINVNYYIQSGHSYYLDTIKTEISSKIVRGIYNKYKKNSFLKKGSVFDYQNLKKESQRLLNIFRNNGIYHLTENHIGFYEIDTLQKNHKTNILLRVKNHLTEKDGKLVETSLNVQKVTDIQIITDYHFKYRNSPYKDTLNYKGYTFLNYQKLRYRPKHLLQSIFIEPNQIYKDSSNLLSKRQLRNLKNFKSVKIKYEPIDNTHLRAKISLTPLEKYSIRFNTEAIHSNVKQLGVSGGLSFINRNLFKGAEILKGSFQGSLFQLSKQNKNSQGILDAWDIGVEASLEIPRFLTPINTEKIINKRYDPHTLLFVGINQQKNIGLDRHKFTGVLEYSWKPSNFQSHKFELLNLQYVRNLNEGSYFDIYASEFEKLENIQQSFFKNKNLNPQNGLNFIHSILTEDFKNKSFTDYQTVQNILNRYHIITNNNIIPKIGYSFHYNNQKNIQDFDYQVFTSKISICGKWSGHATVFEIPISEFAKWDVEFKTFLKDFFSQNIWAFRLFVGVAVPYGDTQEIPFPDSYFAGGSNDIRAWRIYELGLGASSSSLEFKIGNFKLLSNLEYRFKLNKQMSGALFIDAGNIWDITNSKLTSREEKIQSFEDLKNTAIGTGFGIRYDFRFLILRLDLGFKTYEPYLRTKNKWFQHYNFAHSELNIGINYPF